MAWERRGNREYLYQSQRAPDGRIKKVYLGRGQKAAAAAAGRAEALRRHAADVAAGADLRLSLEPLIAWVDDLDHLVDEFTTEQLAAAGFHRARGEWRRRREPRAQ